MSLIRLQKHRMHTAASLLVWLLFCVTLLCTHMMPGAAVAHGAHASEWSGAADHGAASSSDMHHHSQHAVGDDAPLLSNDAGCCGEQGDRHEMSKLLAGSNLLLTYLAVLSVTLFIFFTLPLLLRLLLPHSFFTFKKPPDSSYPALFLTTQRLLN